MSDKNEVSPAFPRRPLNIFDEGHVGMTLRDYFAGQALIGIYAGKAWNDIVLHDNPEAWAYRIADAMIKEREL